MLVFVLFTKVETKWLPVLYYRIITVCVVSDDCYSKMHMTKKQLRLRIKTHDAELQGQEEVGHMQRRSVLFTCSTTVRFVYALNKSPLKLKHVLTICVESVTQQRHQS